MHFNKCQLYSSDMQGCRNLKKIRSASAVVKCGQNLPPWLKYVGLTYLVVEILIGLTDLPKIGTYLLTYLKLDVVILNFFKELPLSYRNHLRKMDEMFWFDFLPKLKFNLHDLFILSNSMYSFTERQNKMFRRNQNSTSLQTYKCYPLQRMFLGAYFQWKPCFDDSYCHGIRRCWWSW